MGCHLIFSSFAQGLPDLAIDTERLETSVLFERKTFSKGSCAVEEECVLGNGKRTVMRFDLTTPNIGVADLVMVIPR